MTVLRSCRGSTTPSKRPSACSFAENACQRCRSTDKVQEGGSWLYSGKRKCLLQFSLPQPCPAFCFATNEKPTPKRERGGRRKNAAVAPLRACTCHLSLESRNLFEGSSPMTKI